MKRIALVLLTILHVSSTAAIAQSSEGLLTDIERWTELAERAENIVDRGRGDDRTFDILRGNIARYRAEFEAARDLNSDRIAALREQITALGPLPTAEGAPPEPEDVAAQRAALTEQLNQLLVPVQRAEAEFVRANALIAQIDQIIRDRRTQRLLTVSPTPLNPTYWPTAAADLTRAVAEVWFENPVRGSQRSITELRETLPIVLLLALVGLVLIARGRRWALAVVCGLRGLQSQGFGLWHFLASLLRMVLPFGGIMALTYAVILTDFFGTQGNALLLQVAYLSGAMLGVRWVSEHVFAADEADALIRLPEEKRIAALLQIGIITTMVVAASLIASLLPLGAPAAASEAVLMFPIFLVLCIALFRFGRILRGFDPRPETPDDSVEFRPSTFRRIVRAAGLGAILVALASPILVAAGYYNAAQSLLAPYTMTLAILGLVMTLQRITADLYGGITGRGAQARETLMPVLFGIILLLCSMPPLALIWGASPTDLTELFAAFGRGFSVGETRISPTDFFAFALIFVIGYTLTRLVQSALRGNVLPKTKIDIGGQNAIVSGVGYIGIFLAALAAISGAGLDLSSIAIVAGALSVGIGFGLQNIVSNFVSGIILLIERPISEGDWIEVGGEMGYVRDISVRSTRIETFARTDVIIPNADLVSGAVTNYTRGNTVGRLIVPVGVAYGTDTRRVHVILQEIVEAQPLVLAKPAPSVVFLNFGADALEFEIRCFLRDVNWVMSVKSEVNHLIAARFAEEGIEIPFAQRDIWLRNPEALKPEPTTPVGKFDGRSTPE